MDSPKVIENLFYAITIVSTFTCIVRSDYNFAFGLLCYYMMKTSKDKIQSSRPVTFIISLNSSSIASVNQCRFNYFRHHLLHYYGQCVVRETTS